VFKNARKSIFIVTKMSKEESQLFSFDLPGICDYKMGEIQSPMKT